MFFSRQQVRAGACGNGRKIKSYPILERLDNYNSGPEYLLEKIPSGDGRVGVDGRDE